MQGKNTIVTTGDYSIGLLSQTSGNLNTDTIIRVNSDGSVTPSFSDGDDTFIVTAGNHAVGVPVSYTHLTLSSRLVTRLIIPMPALH